MQYPLQRVVLACFGVLGTAGLLALAACPGNLENPDQVIANAGSPSGGGNSTGGAAPVDTVDLTCVTRVFTKSCANSSACHQAGATAQAGLDLQTPGFAARLVDVPATHLNGSPGPCPTGDKLIDSATPAASWLLMKIQGKQAMCGFSMPLGAALTTDDAACVTTFVNAEAAEHSGSGTGTAGAGTAGAATAGASSGGSGGASAGSGGM